MNASSASTDNINAASKPAHLNVDGQDVDHVLSHDFAPLRLRPKPSFSVGVVEADFPGQYMVHVSDNGKRCINDMLTDVPPTQDAAPKDGDIDELVLPSDSKTNLMDYKKKSLGSKLLNSLGSLDMLQKSRQASRDQIWVQKGDKDSTVMVYSSPYRVAGNVLVQTTHDFGDIHGNSVAQLPAAVQNKESTVTTSTATRKYLLSSHEIHDDHLKLQDVDFLISLGNKQK